MKIRIKFRKYSKIDTNRIPYTFDRINVNAYFADCVEELSLELEEQNIELAYFSRWLPHWRWDSGGAVL